MTTTQLLLNAPDLSAEDYVVLGLATCYLKEDTDFHPVQIIEPLPSAALESLVKGIPTSYEWAYATTLGTLVSGDSVTLPNEFPKDVQICDDFAERLTAAVRTYRASHEAAKGLIPVGTVYRDFNYSLERKRVLNSERLVKTEDNVKQHEYTHRVL
ncbi:MAG: hypothetical protein WBA57_08000 [Elainellaceae cyanobacterium]